MKHPHPIPSTPATAFKLFLTLTLVLALCVPTLAIVMPPDRASGATASKNVHLVRDGTWIEYDNYRTASMYDKSTGYQIVCAQPSKDSPETGTYTKDYAGIDERIEETSWDPAWVKIRSFLVRAFMYYTHPDSPGFDKTLFPAKNWEGDSWTRNDYIAALHISLSAAYDNSFKAATVGTSDSFKTWAIENITGGFSQEDSVDGKEVFYADSVWGKLLNYDGGGSVAGWNSDANPYYSELPEGFKVYILHPGGADQVCFGFDALGWIGLEKASSLANITNGNRMYSFEGARYGVYSDKNCADLVCEMTVGKDGTAKSEALEPATYYVKELAAPQGYTLNASVVKVEVGACKTVTLTARETPKYAMPELLVQKTNLETGNAAAVAGSTLQGAKFEVSYYDALSDDQVPTRSWTFMSDEDGRVILDAEHFIDGDRFYTDADGTPVFPLGTYAIRETAAPAGYALNTKTYTYTLKDTDDDTTAIVEFDHETTVPEQVLRGDFEFRKIDDGQNGMANVPFLLSYANGEEDELVESHVIVTDVNGEFSSAENAHSSNTNGNDAALQIGESGEYLVDEEKLDPSAGIWFSMDKTGACASPNDSMGALPYGTYLLEELPCTANEGKTLVTTTFSITKGNAKVDLGNIVDSSPKIHTMASDASDADKLIEPQENVRVNDTVRYQNLTVGTSYTLTGTIMDAETGEAIAGEDGNPVTASKQFSPNEENGSLTLSFSLDASGLAGKTLVVFETLSANGKVVCSHESLTDADQSIEVLPKLSTSAADKADGDSYIMSTKAVIVDTVSYEGLQPGKTYKLDAVLMDKATGNVARDAQGKAISASHEFTPENSSGEELVELELDTSVVGGHDVVVFEKLLDEDDFQLAVHEDLEDEGQTLKTVGIGTSAYDSSDKDKYFAAEVQQVTIIDEVSYENLEPGTEYTLVGTLMDKASEEPLMSNGEPIRSVKTFTPDSQSGTVQVELSFNPAEQTASDVVVYESLRYGGNEIAVHADPEDENQTVSGIVPDSEIAQKASSGYVGTGDTAKLPWVVLGVCIATLACALGTMLYRRKLAHEQASDAPDALDDDMS